MFQAKTEEQVAKEKQWLDSERVWLMHRGGFALARKQENCDSESGKIKIQLESNGEILTVDEDDVEKVRQNILYFLLFSILYMFSGESPAIRQGGRCGISAALERIKRTSHTKAEIRHEFDTYLRRKQHSPHSESYGTLSYLL